MTPQEILELHQKVIENGVNPIAHAVEVSSSPSKGIYIEAAANNYPRDARKLVKVEAALAEWRKDLELHDYLCSASELLRLQQLESALKGEA